MSTSSAPQPLSYIAVLLIAVSGLVVSLIVLIRNQVSLEATANEQARQALIVAVSSNDLSSGVRNARSVLANASSGSRVCVLNSIDGRFVPGGEVSVSVVCETESAMATATATGRVGRFRSVGG